MISRYKQVHELTDVFLKQKLQLLLSLLGGNFCRLPKAFANSLDPDQNRHNDGPDLDTNCLTL